MYEKSVIVTDVHGNDEKFRQVLNHYGEGMHYIINGDSIDRGLGTPRLLDIFMDLNVDMVMGNHELVMLGALTDDNLERRDAWQQAWLGRDVQGNGGTEYNMLSAYGVKKQPERADTAELLHEKLARLGHLALLKNAQWYYEDDSVISIHAGIDPIQSWQTQKRYLDSVAALAQANLFPVEPEQLRSFRMARSATLPRDIAKPVITGHEHRRHLNAEERRWPRHTRYPKRVFLASHLPDGDPLFAYETWTGQVRDF
jgi:hypothetical protein